MGGGDDWPLSGVQAFPSYLVNLEAWRLLLYFLTSHQLLSRGPKIAAHRKALRGKTAWRAGFGPATSLEQWEAPWMFTPRGREGVAPLQPLQAVGEVGGYSEGVPRI